jgi:hypothetical protein
MPFSVSGTQIIDPNGQPFIARGINIYAGSGGAAPPSRADDQLLTWGASAVTATFPGINFVRVNIFDFNADSASALQSVVQQLTSQGVVVELEDHNYPNVATGSDLTTACQWYASVASAFKDNPYVWFGTQNEPNPGSGDVHAEVNAVYQAIRGTGNNNIIMVNFDDPTGLISPGMSNVVWDQHFYNNNPNSSNYSDVVASLNRQVSADEAVANIPVVIGEYGPASGSYGAQDDPNGDLATQAVEASGLGSAAWAWTSGDPSFPLLLNSAMGDPSQGLSSYGQTVEQFIAAGASTTGGGSSGTSNPPTPSASGTKITSVSDAPIIDASGNAWTLVQSASNGLQIAINGTVDAITANVVLLETLNGAMVQENASGNWYSETQPNDSWVQIANPNPTPAPTPSPTPTSDPRDPTQIPFASDSVFNLPLGSGAQWQYNAQLAGAGVFLNTAGNYNLNIYSSTAADPLVTVYVDGSAGGPSGTYTFHIPAGAEGAGPAVGGDNSIAIDDTSTHTWYSFYYFHYTSPTTATAAFGSAEPDYGSGIQFDGGNWDSGVGTLRASDLQTGSINHMLRMELDPTMLMSWDRNSTSVVAPYAWPTTREDGFANNPGGVNGSGWGYYTGTIPFGVTIGIPANAAEPADIKANAGADMLWRALQDHGAMVRDSAGSGSNVVFQTDQYVDQSNPLIQSMEQYGHEIMSYTQILINQGPNSVNGGGTPVVPLDPPLSDAPTTSPPPSDPTPSPNGTKITSASDAPIIDASGNAWSLVQSASNGLQIAVNGNVDAITANVVLLETLNGAMVQENSSGNWYSETQPNDSWVQIANPNPTQPPSPAPVTTGSGSDTLVLSISEDAWANGDGTSDANGDAAFTVAVDGKQLAGTFFAHALHAAGASQTFTFKGDWAPGAHTVAVRFLNDAWGGTASTDRNLYVNDVTYDGTDTKQSAALFTTSTKSFNVTDNTATPPAVTGAGQDSLVLEVSEDYYLGDAQFTVSVDGKQLGGTFTATALHSSGSYQTFAFAGDFGTGTHTVAVNFRNDAYGGSPSTDRNLYVNDIIYRGTDTHLSTGIYTTGPRNFSVSGGTTPSVSETGDHGSLQKNLAQTGTYTVGGDSFVLSSNNAVSVTLGTGASQIRFIGPSAVTLTGGSGQATVTADMGNNKFVAGAGSLDVTGGAGKDAYVFHSTSGLLTMEDFSLAKGDTLTIDKAMQGSVHQATDGMGGTMLTFGTTGHGVDLHGVAGLSNSNILWT